MKESADKINIEQSEEKFRVLQGKASNWESGLFKICRIMPNAMCFSWSRWDTFCACVYHLSECPANYPSIEATPLDNTQESPATVIPSLSGTNGGQPCTTHVLF